MKILSTALMSETDVYKAMLSGMYLIGKPLVRIKLNRNDGFIEEVKSLNENQVVVFTSSNAIDAVLYADRQVNWNIYCIEGRTSAYASFYLPKSKIVGSAKDAAGLSELIVKDGVQSAVFFCGDRRLETLPSALNYAGIQLREIEAYSTELVKEHFDRFDAILFYSPSAVQAYFSCNNPDPDTVLFAIGGTTANAIEETGIQNKIITGTIAGKTELLTEAIEYLKQSKS